MLSGADVFGEEFEYNKNTRRKNTFFYLFMKQYLLVKYYVGINIFSKLQSYCVEKKSQVLHYINKYQGAYIRL